MSNLTYKQWPRAIILVDMNAFFASVDQLDFPELGNKPLAITNGEMGKCIITASYEARKLGIKTGMSLYEGKKLCPKLIHRPARHKRYAQVSQNIMEALETVTPDIEQFSIDEAFLDVTQCQAYHGTPERMGALVKQIVFNTSGLSCSVGISGDKTTAKYAASIKKPDGFIVVPPWKSKTILKNVPVKELCGIGKGVAEFLAQHGVYRCGDIEKLPISILSKRFGQVGRRIWHMCLGADPTPVKTQAHPPKSIGHSKIIPSNTNSQDLILTFLLYLCEKVAMRLRAYKMQAQHFFIGLRSHQHGWISDKTHLALATDDSQLIFQLCKKLLRHHWHGEPIYQVQVTALDPQFCSQQLNLFYIDSQKRVELNQVVDKINQRFGDFTVHASRIKKVKLEI